MPNLTINSTTYPYPDVNDTGWGQEAIDWAQAVSVELTTLTTAVNNALVNPMTATGDVIYNDTTPQALPIGTTGQLLTVGATGLPEWANASLVASPLTTDGDIYVQSAGIDARLPIGNDDDILSVQSGVLTWIPSPAGLGDINAGANLTPGEGVFAQKNVNTLEFKGVEGIGTVQATSNANTVTLQPRSPSFLLSTSPGVSPAREYDVLYAQDFFSESTPGSSTTSTNSLYCYSSDAALFEIGFMGNPGVNAFTTGFLALIGNNTTETNKSLSGELRVLVNSTVEQIYEIDNNFPGGLAGATTVNFTSFRRIQFPWIGYNFLVSLPAGESQIQLELELGTGGTNDVIQYRGTWYSKKVR